jgi:hypothetical protein
MNSDCTITALIAFHGHDARRLTDAAERGHDKGRKRKIEPGQQSAADRGKPQQSGDDRLKHGHALQTPVAAVLRA